MLIKFIYLRKAIVTTVAVFILSSLPLISAVAQNADSTDDSTHNDQSTSSDHSNIQAVPQVDSSADAIHNNSSFNDTIDTDLSDPNEDAKPIINEDNTSDPRAGR